MPSPGSVFVCQIWVVVLPQVTTSTSPVSPLINYVASDPSMDIAHFRDYKVFLQLSPYTIPKFFLSCLDSKQNVFLAVDFNSVGVVHSQCISWSSFACVNFNVVSLICFCLSIIWVVLSFRSYNKLLVACSPSDKLCSSSFCQPAQRLKYVIWNIKMYLCSMPVESCLCFMIAWGDSFTFYLLGQLLKCSEQLFFLTHFHLMFSLDFTWLAVLAH